MSWNFRVVRSTRTEPDGTTGEEYAIHEAYGRDVGTEVQSLTERPVAPSASTVDGLRWVLDRMLAALDKPVLEEDLSGDRRML